MSNKKFTEVFDTFAIYFKINVILVSNNYRKVYDISNLVSKGKRFLE